jgi:hypothetical protein
MLLTNDCTKRFDIPHEPGEWVEIRRLSGYQTHTLIDAKATLADDPVNWAYRWMEACVVVWSYAEPVSPDTLKRLDAATSIWLVGACRAYTMLPATLEEKKSVASSSTGP